MATLSYWQLPAFRDVSLDEGALFSVRELGAELRLDVEVVLGERHPDHQRSEGGDPRCYRRARIVFRAIRGYGWTKGPAGPAEPAASADLGAIESFLVQGDRYALRGAFGTIELHASFVELRLL